MLDFLGSVLISLSLPFYWITEMLFRVFFVLAEGQLLTPDKYQVLISNFYVIIGVVLLFFIAFSLLKNMINPDNKKGTESTKKIILNIVTSAIILVLLPSIFTFAYDVQTSIIGSEYNVIGKFFGFGANNAEVIDGNRSNVSQAASTVTNSIFTAFFNVNTSSKKCENPENVTSLEYCQKEITLKRRLTGVNSLSDSDKTTFYDVVQHVNTTGQLRLYAHFAGSWIDGDIEFNILLSVICGLILIYVVASFCIDMAIRMVKLVFYQLIAPVPLFFRVIPDTKVSGTFDKWVKVTLACYFEIYIRIIIVYFVLFICLQVKDAEFLNISFGAIGPMAYLIVKALVFVGLITFMRQAPKLISEITGIDTGNMNLGIREKLATGGAFTAGAIIGAGATTLVNNAISGGKNVKNKWGETKGFKGKAGLIAGAVGSTIAGTASGAVRSGKAGLNAKSGADMKNAAASGAKAAINARDKRAAYKASHGGTIGGVITGHFKDKIDDIKEWAGYEDSAAAVEGYYTNAANVSKAYNDAVEKTYKTKEAYIDLDNKVKALKNLKKSGKATSAELAELNRLEASLETMRITESMKKVTNIRSAAYRLSYDHKMNYSNDQEMKDEFESGLVDGFFQLDNKGGKAEFVGKNSSGLYEFKVTDGKGSTSTMTLDENTYKIYEAMRKGEEFKVELIGNDNVIKVQDAIDNVNIHRQNLSTRKADEAFRAQQEKKKQEGK